MRGGTFLGLAGLVLSVPALGNADFKYIVSSQVTGGPLAKVVPPGESTIYVRTDYLRIELSDGSYVIGDLKQRSETWVNPKTRTYSVLNYDKMFGPPAPGGQTVPAPRQKSAVNAPTLTTTSTGKTQILVGQPTQEVTGKLTENPDSYCETDSWMAPSVRGFDAVNTFYSKLVSALALPNQSSDVSTRSDPAAKTDRYLWLAMQTAAMKDPVWAPAMMRVIFEITSCSRVAKGLPMLQTLKVITMMTEEQQARLRLREQQPPPAARGAVSTPSAAAGSNPSSAKEPVSAAEFTFRVTSYSAQPLEESLFEVPPGYVLKEASKNDVWPAAILP